MTQHDNGLITETTPDMTTRERPVAPSWNSIAAQVQRWQMALIPWEDGTWDVQPHWNAVPARLEHDVRRVPFAQLPQAIADVAARCEQEVER